MLLQCLQISVRGGNNKHCYFLTEKEIYANDMLRDDLTVKLHLVYGVDMSAAEQQKPNKVTGNRESSSECGI